MVDTSGTKILSFVAGARIRATTSGEWSVETPAIQLRLGRPAPGLLEALRLVERGAPEDDVADHLVEAEGESALPSLYLMLRRLIGAGVLSHTVRWQDADLATLTPLSAAHPSAGKVALPDERFHLSRFASARREGCSWIVESPRAHATVTLHDRRAAALLLDLSAPRTARDLSPGVGLPVEVLCQLLSLLLEAAVVVPHGASGSAEEEEDPALRLWEPHDLWFHAHSRRRRRCDRYGATQRLPPGTEPPPVVRRYDAPSVPLDRADIDGLRAADVPFTRVIEERRSVRAFGDEPMTCSELGQLLFRAARIRGRRGEGRLERTDRPYPGGGACYELEIYPVVRRCSGLDAGLYHYDAEEHRLHFIRGRDKLVERLIDEGTHSATARQTQVLLVLAARFQRVSSNYAAMAYALILKDTGILLHNIGLVAQAMGLGACPLGGGDAALFAEAAGTDPLVETSVGELLLGSRASSSE